MEIPKVKQILKKANDLKTDKDISLAKEFISLEEQMSSIENKIDSKNNKDVIEEVKTLSEKIDNIPEPKEFPEFPTKISISNLPDIQNVKVLNFPEVKVPVVNVKSPEVNVEAPIVNIDTENIENQLKISHETLKEISEKLNKDEEVEKEIEQVTLVDKNGKPITFFGGSGGIGKQVYNSNNESINPATEETLQSIADSSWVSSNIDMADATYYYFLSFIPDTTKWRINRLNKTSYVSDYATGESSISTAWTDRATQTYATIY